MQKITCREKSRNTTIIQLLEVKPWCSGVVPAVLFFEPGSWHVCDPQVRGGETCSDRSQNGHLGLSSQSLPGLFDLLVAQKHEARMC